MKQLISKSIIFFMILTAILASIGLLIMDRSLDNALKPELLDAPGEIPESLNGIRNVVQVKDQGELDAIYMDNPDSRFVVLYCHDPRGHLHQRVPILEKFQELNLSVLAIDYRGFGASSNIKITDETLGLDLKYAYEALLRKKWKINQIILYGQGLSAGIQGLLLIDKQVGGWILDNPVPSLPDAIEFRLARFLTAERLSLYQPLSLFKGPVMVFHDPETTPESTLSRLVETRNGIEFCEIRGRRSPGEWDGADWDAWMVCIRRFLDQMAVLPDTARPPHIPLKKPSPEMNPELEASHDKSP